MTFRSGFVNIIGSPNVGKSTLMNKLLGQKLVITNPKAQTTRHRVLGIVNGEDHQIVFSDTPGIMEPGYKLHESMMGYVEEALDDADVLLFIADSGKNKIPEKFLEKLKATDTPLLVLINKMDLHKPDKLEAIINKWHEILPKAKIAPMSALHGFNTDLVLEEIVKYLPEGPAYYDTETLTNKNVRFFVGEIIRDKILEHFKEEVPYSCEVEISEYQEGDDLDKIYAYIYVARDSQKSILIGKDGRAMKRMGTDARRSIEQFVGKKVYLDLRVKVRTNWRDNPEQLKRFGY